MGKQRSDAKRFPPRDPGPPKANQGMFSKGSHNSYGQQSNDRLLKYALGAKNAPLNAGRVKGSK